MVAVRQYHVLCPENSSFFLGTRIFCKILYCAVFTTLNQSWNFSSATNLTILRLRDGPQNGVINQISTLSYSDQPVRNNSEKYRGNFSIRAFSSSHFSYDGPINSFSTLLHFYCVYTWKTSAHFRTILLVLFGVKLAVLLYAIMIR